MRQHGASQPEMSKWPDDRETVKKLAGIPAFDIMVLTNFLSTGVDQAVLLMNHRPEVVAL